jgi:DNA-binding CsgD family transcriptional regulator
VDLPASLTRRELEVLRLLAEGRTDREVAAALGVSHRTATTHVTGIFNKLGVTTRTAAVAQAIRAGLV